MTNPIWRDVLNTLEPTMSRPNFATWLASTDLIEEIPGALTITVPNQYAKSWLENNIIGDIEKLLKKSVENFEQVRIVVAKRGASSLDDLPILQKATEETDEKAIADEAPKKNPFNPKKKIAYVSCETFASEFIEALQNKAINEFKRKYRSVDVFLVDDIQFLANKEGTQEEFSTPLTLSTKLIARSS